MEINRYNNIIYADNIRDYIVNNDLLLLDRKLIDNTMLSDYDLFCFHEIIKLNYFYDAKYNNIYWTGIWLSYAIKHNVDYDIIKISNDFYLLFKNYNYNNKLYDCLVYNDNLICYKK